MPTSEGYYANSSGYVVNLPNTILSSGSISISSTNTISSMPSFYTSFITPAATFPLDITTPNSSFSFDIKVKGITSPIIAIISFFYDLCHLEGNRFKFHFSTQYVDQHASSVLFYLLENQDTIFKKYNQQNAIKQINDAYEKDDFSGLFPDLRKECERIYELSKIYTPEIEKVYGMKLLKVEDLPKGFLDIYERDIKASSLCRKRS